MMSRWLFRVAVFLFDAMGLGDSYQFYRFLVEFHASDDTGKKHTISIVRPADKPAPPRQAEKSSS